MSSQIERDPERTSPGLEFLRVSALLAVFSAQLYLGSRIAKQPADYCFTKPLWLDEFHTLALIKEDRPDQLLIKLSRGADFNPPGLHIVLWLISRVTSLSDEWLLRSFSCFVGITGLVATYFLLRVQFSWSVSWVAVMGMWSSSPQLFTQMFEGRFYSFWFGTVALLCLLLTVRATGIWQAVCVAAAAAMMCSIHYFGIITLGLIAVGQLGGNCRDLRQRWLISAAVAAGTLTLIVSLPFYLGQRAAIPVPTWVAPPTLASSAVFINEFSLSYALILPLLAYVCQRLIVRVSGSDSSENVLTFTIYAGTCALILLPVALTVFSYVIQPAQVSRYALPAILAHAPLIAGITCRLHRALLTGTALLFFVIGLNGATGVYQMPFDYHNAAAIAHISSVARPLIVHSRHDAYPLFRYTGINPQVVRVSYLYRGNTLNRFDALEQAVTRRMAQLFDLPRTIESDELASLDEFYLLVREGEEQRYEGWTAEPLGLGLVTGHQGASLRMYHMRRIV